MYWCGSDIEVRFLIISGGCGKCDESFSNKFVEDFDLLPKAAHSEKIVELHWVKLCPRGHMCECKTAFSVFI